jgi:hypothetical protein
MKYPLRLLTSFLAIALCIIGAAPKSAWGATCSVSFQVAHDTYGNRRLVPGAIAGDEDCPAKPLPNRALKAADEYQQGQNTCTKIAVLYNLTNAEANCISSPIIKKNP